MCMENTGHTGHSIGGYMNTWRNKVKVKVKD